MRTPLIEINDWSGGMSLNEKMGKTNQFTIGTELDFSSKPGYLTAGYGWTNMTENSHAYVPTEFQAILHAIKDANQYFAGEDTIIYKQSNSTTIASEHDSTQAGTIRSLVEYKGYMLYVQDTTIGTFDLAETPTYDDDFKTGLTSDIYHPIFVSADNKVYFGHGQYIGLGTDPTDAATFTLNALDLADGWKVRTLCDYGYTYLASGINYYSNAGTSSKCKVILWNRTDSSWNDEIPIPEREIKAIIFDSGYLWVWAGRSCNLYVIPEGSRKATKMWSFVKENPGDIFEVYPNAVLSRNGTIYFGLSGVGTESVSKNPCAIYSFPADPNNFSLNIIKTVEYGDRIKSLGLRRIATYGDIIYVGHYDTSATNKNLLIREKLYEANPYSNSNFGNTFRYDAPKNKKMFTEAFGITYDPLPTGTSISVSYKKDNDTSFTSIITTDTATSYEKTVYLKIPCSSLQMQVVITPNVNSCVRPFLKSLFVTGYLINKT